MTLVQINLDNLESNVWHCATLVVKSSGLAVQKLTVSSTAIHLIVNFIPT
jgi:hypothetical protein